MSTNAALVSTGAARRPDHGDGLASPEKVAPWLELLKTGASGPSKAYRDRAAAEEGVRLAYVAAGLPPPEIVWCDGPVGLTRAWAAAALSQRAGGNAREVVFDRPYRAAMRRIAVFDDGTARLVREVLVGEHPRAVAAAVEAVVVEELGDVRPPLMAWWHRPRRSAQGPRDGWRATFANCGLGPGELHDAGLAAHIIDAIEGDAGPALNGHRLIAENAGWLVPHERVCWLSEPPEVLGADPQGRLHCASGPALRYPDGWTVHAWKGAPVPAWIVTQPEQITLRWIDAQIDPRVRHAMIDILTPERFIAEGGANATATDGTGTIWRRKWSHRGVIIDTWAAVEYASGPTAAAGKRIFRCIPADLGTPGEALAWLSSQAPEMSS